MSCLSCHSIEGELVFHNANKLTFCSLIRPPEDGGGCPAYKEVYNGEPIDWDDFFAFRNQKRRLIKEHDTLPECGHCMYIREFEQYSENKITKMLITNYVKCNSRCIYCPPYDVNHVVYNIVPVLKDAIEKKIIDKDCAVEFAGGEPTVYPWFEEALDVLLKNKFEHITVNSNLINFSERIYSGIENGVLDLTVSLDAGTKDVHEKIKRVKSFDTVINNLSKYASVIPANKKNIICSKFIIVPGLNDKKSEIKTWLETTEKIGINKVALNIDNRWIFTNENNIDGMKNIFDLTDFFIDTSEQMKFEYKIFPNIADIAVRYNIMFPDAPYKARFSL